MTVHQILVANAICPKLIRRGRHILLIEIPEFGIRFLSSHNFLKGNEYNLADQFHIPYKKHYFPEKLLRREYFNFEGSWPSNNLFSDFDSTIEDQTNLLDFLEENKTKYWNFKAELFHHFDQKLQILVHGMITFVKDSLSFQFDLKNSTKSNEELFLNL